MNPAIKRRTFLATAWLSFAGLLLTFTITSFAAEKIVWKAFVTALVRVDDSAPKVWNLYHTGKKADPLLLQLGGRSFVIYLRDQAVYELTPAQLEHKVADLLWLESDRPEKPMTSSNWTTRDVGYAWRIRFTLTGEGRMFDIQVQQTPDLKSLL